MFTSEEPTRFALSCIGRWGPRQNSRAGGGGSQEGYVMSFMSIAVLLCQMQPVSIPVLF